MQNILRSNVNQPKPSVLPKRLEVPLGLSIMARLFGLSRMPIRINSCMALLGSLKRLWWPFLAPITLFDEEPCWSVSWLKKDYNMYMILCIKIYKYIIQEVPASWVHARCANAHNCFGLTLGRWWNSDHVVLKLSIRTSASPWREQSELASGTLTKCF